MATSTGWTFSEVENLTLWDVNDLMEYWSEHPPAHIILAAVHFRHTKRKKKTEQISDAAQDLAQYSAALGFTGIAGPLPAVYRDK